MVKSLITPQQAAAILTNGKPFGVGGKTIQVVGLSQKSETPLFTRSHFTRNPNGDPHNLADGTTVVEESTKVDLPPINDLLGGLDWQALRDANDRIATFPPEKRCYIKDGSAKEPPISGITVITINFNKQKLEEIQQKGAGASKNR